MSEKETHHAEGKKEEKEEEKKEKREGFSDFLKKWQEVIALSIGSAAGFGFLEHGLSVLSSSVSTPAEINGAIATAIIAAGGLIWGISVDISRRKKIKKEEEKEKEEEEHKGNIHIHITNNTSAAPGAETNIIK